MCQSHDEEKNTVFTPSILLSLQLRPLCMQACPASLPPLGSPPPPASTAPSSARRCRQQAAATADLRGQARASGRAVKRPGRYKCGLRGGRRRPRESPAGPGRAHLAGPHQQHLRLQHGGRGRLLAPARCPATRPRCPRGEGGAGGKTRCDWRCHRHVPGGRCARGSRLPPSPFSSQPAAPAARPLGCPRWLSPGPS